MQPRFFFSVPRALPLGFCLATLVSGSSGLADAAKVGASSKDSTAATKVARSQDAPAPTAAHPDEKRPAISALTEAELEKTVHDDVSALGSLSVGIPNNGRLLNGTRPQDGALFEVVAPDFAWGTEETVRFLTVAAEAVQKKHADTPPLHLGHISRDKGGYLNPHLSHQSGRDVDIGYYYTQKRAWYRRATWDNLDVARTWTFVRALITHTDVEMILIDGSLQNLLRAHATKSGEDKEWLQRVFKGDGQRGAIIRHVRGHATHMHVRFFSPEAQRNAQIVYPLLVEEQLVDPVTVYAHHRVRKGDTLGRLARLYGTSVVAIQRANGLRGTKIQAKKVYKIPRPGGPMPVDGQLEFPSRQLP